MDGGGHEQGFRSGTLNVPGIVGFGEACRLCQASMSESAARLSALRDRIEAGMLALGGVQVNGSREHRLPHVTNLSFEGVPGSALITAATKTLALSSGSACTSALPEPSHVLLAMGVPESLAMASLRISLGRYTTAEEAEFAVTRLREVVGELRSEG
jgi:cysteine desulfurase